MRKTICALLLSLLLLGAALPALADGEVTDKTGYLTYSQIESLEDIAAGIREEWGINALILFVDRTPGYTQSESQSGYYGLRDYAADYYDSLYPGQDGVVFAVRLSDRWYVSVTTGRGETMLSTDTLDAAEEAARPYLSSGDYYYAFRTYLNRIDYSLQVYADPTIRLKEMLPFIGGFSAVITALVLLIIRHTMKTARRRDEAGNYVTGARITRRQDIYLYTTKTRRRIQTESSGGGIHGGGGHFGGGGGHGSSHGGRF